MRGTRETLAFAAGGAAVVAFEPFGLYPAAVLSLALLLRLWHDATPAQAARLGFAFGFGLFLFGVHWIYISVRNFGGAPIPAAVAAVFAVAFAQALWVALCGYLQSIVRMPRFAKFLFLAPALWVAAEGARGWFLSGFPWLQIGYSQTDSWLNGWAPIAGVLGVSFAACVTAGALSLLQFKREAAAGNALALSVAACLWIGGALAGRIEWVEAMPKPLSAALVQADVSIEDKFDRLSASRTLEHFIRLSDEAHQADLIVWPETALAYTAEQLRDTQFFDYLRRHPSDFLFGVLEYRQGDITDSVSNSVYGVAGDIEAYRKSHLVPFGEYVPLRSVFSLFGDSIHLPDDMAAFKGAQQPIRVAGFDAGVSICFEIAFAGEVLKMLPEASFLVNVSEDAWFGTRIAPYQQLQMVRMRAMETGRPVLRAANRGISAAVDSKGRVIDMLRQADGTVLKVDIRPAQGQTPFVGSGGMPMILLSLAVAAACSGAAIMRRIARRKSRG